jgi:hypothetical protein
MDVNLPGVVAEVAERFRAYEQALVEGDNDRLDADFWDAPEVVRYGVRENLYGPEEIAAWRRVAPPIPADRTLGPTVVATFGHDFATVSTEFRSPGSPVVGRQTQAWARLPEGWRIVAAHVSILKPDAA